MALAALAYLAVCAYIANQMTLAVRNPLQSTPADFGMAYEAVAFPSLGDQIPLRGWYIGKGGRQTILMLHAKDGRRDDPTIGLMEIARGLVQHGYNVFVFDFRGHGESGGTRVGVASLEVRDVGGALEYLKTRGITQVGTLGFSMGAATALNSAAVYPAMHVVVADSPFADFQELLNYHMVTDAHLPALFTPGTMFISWPLFGMDFGNDKPARALAQLGSRPVLLIHSANDTDVPMSHDRELQAAGASDPNLRTWLVPGAAHVRAFRTLPDEYMRRVTEFFDEFLR